MATLATVPFNEYHSVMTQAELEAALAGLGWRLVASYTAIGFKVFRHPGRLDELRVPSRDPLEKAFADMVIRHAIGAPTHL